MMAFIAVMSFLFFAGAAARFTSSRWIVLVVEQFQVVDCSQLLEGLRLIVL
jgi:hypothetical protein